MECLARKFKFQNYFEFLRKKIVKNWNFWRENSNYFCTFKTSIWSSSIVRFKMLPISSGVEIDLFFLPNPAAMTFCAFLKKFKINLKFTLKSQYSKIRIFWKKLLNIFEFLRQNWMNFQSLKIIKKLEV